MPSVASFMDISIPKEQLMEIDGISLTGNLSVTEMNAHYENGTILLNWKGAANKGKLKVWLSTSNHYKTGGRDQYELMQTVSIQDGKATINVKEKPSKFYKVVIEAPHNFLNRWILIP